MAGRRSSVRAGSLKRNASVHPAKIIADYTFCKDCPLSAHARLIMNAIGHLLHTNAADGRWSAWIYYNTLASHAGISVTTVKKALKEIRELAPGMVSMFRPPEHDRPIIKGAEFSGYRFTWIAEPSQYQAKRDELLAWKRDVLPLVTKRMAYAYGAVLKARGMTADEGQPLCEAIRRDAARFLERAITVVPPDRLVDELISYGFLHARVNEQLVWHPEGPSSAGAGTSAVTAES